MEQGVPAKALRSYRKAVQELHRGQTMSAGKDAERAIQGDRKFADAYALAATVSLVQQHFSSAQKRALQATQFDPQDEKAWVIAATAENYLGQYQEAAGALGHVQPSHRSTWQVAYQWARAEAGQGDAQQALEWSNRAALTAPSSFAPLHLLRASAMLAIHQYARSADELETYMHLIAPDAPQQQELAQELQRVRRLAESNATASAGTVPEAAYNALAN